MKLSKKRQAQLRAYDKAKAELEIELKNKGEWICFFSGIPFPDHFTWRDVTWHHNARRDGDMLTEKDFLRPVLDEYHTGNSGYHNKPISFLKEQTWWEGYLNRLKTMSEDLWYREKQKETK